MTLGDYYDPEARNARLRELEFRLELERTKQKIEAQMQWTRLEKTLLELKPEHRRVTVTHSGKDLYSITLLPPNQQPQMFHVHLGQTVLLMRLGALGCHLLHVDED